MQFEWINNENICAERIVQENPEIIGGRSNVNKQLRVHRELYLEDFVFQSRSTFNTQHLENFDMQDLGNSLRLVCIYFDEGSI